MPAAQVLTDDLCAIGFGNLEFTLAGNIYTFVAKVSFDQPLEEGSINGTHTEVQKRTEGQMKLGNGEIEFLDIAESQRFIGSLGNQWRRKIWNSTWTAWRPGQPSVRFDFLECRVLNEKGDFSEGVESLHETVPFSYKKYLRNGQSPV
jgi:hypothetical protein